MRRSNSAAEWPKHHRRLGMSSRGPIQHINPPARNTRKFVAGCASKNCSCLVTKISRNSRPQGVNTPVLESEGATMRSFLELPHVSNRRRAHRFTYALTSPSAMYVCVCVYVRYVRARITTAGPRVVVWVTGCVSSPFVRSDPCINPGKLRGIRRASGSWPFAYPTIIIHGTRAYSRRLFEHHAYKHNYAF